jgi:hypothetical protein
MSKCKCGRELRLGETECPACKSKKSHGWKKFAEVAGGVALVCGIIVKAIFAGKRKSA